MAKKLVTRNIHMFLMQVMNADGVNLDDQGVVWRDVTAMPYARRATQLGDDVVSARVFRFSGHHAWGVYRAAKHRDLPRKIDNQERTSDLGLDVTDGLEFASHWGWWNLSHCHGPDRAEPLRMGVLAYEHNQLAPRASSLERYLNGLFDGKAVVSIVPLIGLDVWEELERHPYVASIQVRVARPAPSTGGRGLAALWGVAPEAAMRAAVEFRAKRRKKMTRAEVIHHLHTYVSLSEAESVRVDFGQGATLDLLQGKMTHRAKVPLDADDVRAVSSAAMMKELHNAFQRHLDGICKQLSVEWRTAPLVPVDDLA